MKQFFTTITCALLAALASCSNDHVLYDYTKTDNTPIEIATSIGGVDVLTKAATDVYSGGENGKHFDEKTKVNVYIFENVENGQTRVYNYGIDGKVEYTADANGVLKASPTNYFPGNGHGIDIYGIYPTSIVASTQQTFTVNTDQSDDAKYKASDLMFAEKKTETNRKAALTLTFKHQLSKVIVKLKEGNGLNDNDLEGAEVKILNTKPACTIGSVGENGMTGINASGDAQEIKVGTWDSSTTSGLAAIVVPQTIPEGTALIQVKLSNGVTYKYTTKSGDNQFSGFLSGNQHTFTLTLSTFGITVNAEISGWGEGTGDDNGEATLK